MPVLDEIEAAIPSLRAYARGLMRDRDAADDLVQDTLESAVAHMGQWRGEGALRGWLFPAAPAAADGRLQLAEVHAAMGRLPEDQRAALLLVGLEGMSIAEAAEVLGIAQGTLASRLGRARAALRQMTGRDDDSRPRKGNGP